MIDSPNMRHIKWAAGKYFPDKVDEIAALLQPYDRLSGFPFRTALWQRGVIENPAFTKWEEARRDVEATRPWDLNSRSDARQSIPSVFIEQFGHSPVEQVEAVLFERRGKLRNVLSFVSNWKYEIKVWTIGKDWVPEGDVDKDSNNLYELGQMIFPAQIEQRVNLDSRCLDHARSITMKMQESIMRWLEWDGSYRYNLISHQDIFHLTCSILGAVERAIVLTAIHPDPPLVEKVMRFVDWQLGGNPIVRYRKEGDGLVEILSAPRHKVLGAI